MSLMPEVLPLDQHNSTLVNNVHPPDWVNPQPASRYNLVVLGAGTAGLVTAAAAASLGARVALVERHYLGGDCLNVGCVPSKCLIRSARAAFDVREAGRFGIRVPPGSEVDFSQAMERMRQLRAKISFHDSATRFSQLGVDVFLGRGQFESPHTVSVDGVTLRFKKAVIATGGRPIEPPIDGLKQTGYLTNETVFNLTERPNRLLVLGGGPLGCELAQAFSRLGSQVTLIQISRQFLPREDPDAARILERSMQKDGVNIRLGARTTKVVSSGSQKEVHVQHQGRTETLQVDELLVGVGRAPNVQHLNLEAAGVEYDEKTGVAVNDRLQTSRRHIYAAGDVCLRYKFTHTADAAARLVIRNALFLGRQKASAMTIPWCTYTDPEIAHVGMYEGEAERQGIALETFKIVFSEVDRAVADGDDEGFVKIHVKKGSDRILGATIVARHAGEMLGEISLSMVAGVGLGKISEVIHSYPTQAEAIRKAADAYNRTRLTPRVARLFKRWLRWTR